MKVYKGEKDKLLDHEYDGIKELDNHMPFWWLWLFFCTIAIAVIYLMYYQVLGWGPTQFEEYQQEMAAAEAKYGSPDEGESVEAYAWSISQKDEDIEAGKEMFHGSSQLCFSCHGANAQGMVGPNLTDNYWIHGCKPSEIAASIVHGYPDMGMLAYGSGSKISNEKVEQLISYIASLQGTNPPDAKEVDQSRAQPCTEGPLAQSES